MGGAGCTFAWNKWSRARRKRCSMPRLILRDVIELGLGPSLLLCVAALSFTFSFGRCERMLCGVPWGIASLWRCRQIILAQQGSFYWHCLVGPIECSVAANMAGTGWGGRDGSAKMLRSDGRPERTQPSGSGERTIGDMAWSMTK